MKFVNFSGEKGPFGYLLRSSLFSCIRLNINNRNNIRILECVRNSELLFSTNIYEITERDVLHFSVMKITVLRTVNEMKTSYPNQINCNR